MVGIFNTLAIKTVGLNGNSFSDGKITTMEETAKKVSELKALNKIAHPNQNKVNELRKEICEKITTLGNETGYFCSFNDGNGLKTRSAVVMATLTAYALSGNVPADIAEVNSILTEKIGASPDFISEFSPDNKTYFNEVMKFIDSGYKSISGTDSRRKLHNLFVMMGGCNLKSETNLFGGAPYINNNAKVKPDPEEIIAIKKEISTKFQLGHDLVISIALTKLKSFKTKYPSESLLDNEGKPSNSLATFCRENNIASELLIKLDKLIEYQNLDIKTDIEKLTDAIKGIITNDRSVANPNPYYLLKPRTDPKFYEELSKNPYSS